LLRVAFETRARRTGYPCRTQNPLDNLLSI